MSGLGVVRRNPEFRRIWLSQLVSQGGDWLSRMAVLSLISQLGGDEHQARLGLGLLFATELATRLMPTALMSPIAGPLADRLSRRAVMIWADFLRIGIVISLLFIRQPEHLPILYVLVALQMSVAIFFDSARSASVASVVPKEELHEAYALTAITWSMMLSVGALVGGLLVDLIGISGVFILDAFTYLLSAALLWKLSLPKPTEEPRPFSLRDIVLARDMREALAHVRAKGLLVIISAKSLWGAAGGYLVLLSVAANDRFGATGGELEASAGRSTGELAMDVSTAMGLYYCARGIGTGVGPVLAKRLHGSHDQALVLQISVGFLMGSLGYLLFSFISYWPLSLLCLIFAHMGGSTIWVATTTLWQKRVEDRFRGRVFALEFLGMTLSFTLGGLIVGWFYDYTSSLEQALWLSSGSVLVLGSLWTLWVRSRPLPAPSEPKS